MKTVPILETDYALVGSVDDLLAYADAKSVISPDILREGIVMRPMVECVETIGGTLQRFSFKVISNSYLLKIES